MITQLLESGWRFRLLLLVLLLAIVGMPVIAEFSGIDTVPIGLTIIVLGVLAASGRKACLNLLLPVGAVLGMVWVCTMYPGRGMDGLHYLATSGLFLLSAFLAINYLKESREIDQEALSAAAAVYLLFGLACGGIYAALGVWHPSGLEFSGMTHQPVLHDHIYFSFVVLTTIGFGDVVPRDALTRSIAMLEGVIGLFYMAFVIARLVGLYHQRNQTED